LPSSVTGVGAPALQRFVVGWLLNVWPFDEPQTPLTPVACNEAEHCAVVPPLLPEQLHDHGPVPETPEAVPVLHKLAVGLLLRLSPFDDPQAPLTAAAFSDAAHCAVLPPLLPAQSQLHGPLPLIADAVPAVQRLVVGLLLRLSPFDDPQVPLTGAGFSEAVHCAVVPPFLPAQLHDHGPLPLIAEAVPVVHRLVVGTLLRLSPLDAPHAPLTGAGFSEAVHSAVVPPFLPAQLHDHGPLPLIADAVPVVHRLIVGVLLRLSPLDAPHAPLTAVDLPPPEDVIEPELDEVDPDPVSDPLDELVELPELEEAAPELDVVAPDEEPPCVPESICEIC
jgi:hypothetical protein